MKGNDAVSEAAIRAGCRFFSGYPITPQSEIVEYMSWRLDEVGGSFVQSESELSGISMIYGAAACGLRTMGSSSGPGFDLIQEGIGYIVSAELPTLLVDVVRYGNGLGEIV
ncbi:MAG: 3-methyl-2-oxobutanoate dehydrogenase subunit beta, partial [Eubacteriales bacterium]|nr:3-methyl-2-oxobutanoate dehydrogenase subunit beta [Eubacteriales bacterium]